MRIRSKRFPTFDTASSTVTRAIYTLLRKTKRYFIISSKSDHHIISTGAGGGPEHGKQKTAPQTWEEKRMKTLRAAVAIDSFKGSLDSETLGRAAARGIRKASAGASVRVIPVADGGEGTSSVLRKLMKAETVSAEARDPEGKVIEAEFGLSGKSAVLEMAAASGLTLVQEKRRNPWRLSTAGTGDLLLAAAGKGADEIIIGIGGSATSDAGSGFLHALGGRFYDSEGRDVVPVPENFLRIVRADLSAPLAFAGKISLTAASDVMNPLLGENGAAFVFARQKGAREEDLGRLDEAARHIAEVISEAAGNDMSAVPGAGAAGGLGFALLTLGAELRSGIDLILDAADFDRTAALCDFVITGEGSVDRSTSLGKVPYGVARRASAIGVPAIALAGRSCVDADGIGDTMLTSVFPVHRTAMTEEQAMDPALTEHDVETAAFMIARTFAAAVYRAGTEPC